MNNCKCKKHCQLYNNCNMEDDNNVEDMMAESETMCQNIVQVPENNCNCGFDNDTNSVFPDNPMLGQSYVPIQKMKKVLNSEVGLKMGTIFPELVSPYAPCQSIREIEYLKNTNEIGEGCNK